MGKCFDHLSLLATLLLATRCLLHKGMHVSDIRVVVYRYTVYSGLNFCIYSSALYILLSYFIAPRLLRAAGSLSRNPSCDVTKLDSN